MILVKLEIDLENLSALRTQRAQLTKMLALIDLALSQDQRHAGQNGGITGNETPENAGDDLVASIIQRLPTTFNGSDVYEAVEAQGSDLSRGAIRAALGRAVVAEQIRIIEMGQGRRPTSYEKMA